MWGYALWQHMKDYAKSCLSFIWSENALFQYYIGDKENLEAFAGEAVYHSISEIPLE